MAEDAKAPAGQFSMPRRTVLYLLVFAGTQSMFLFMAYRLLPAKVLFFWRFPRPWGIWADSSEMIVPFCLFLSEAMVIYFGSLYAADAYFGPCRELRMRAIRAAALAAGLVALLVVMHLVYAALLIEMKRVVISSDPAATSPWPTYTWLSLHHNWLPLAVALVCFAGGVAMRFFRRPSSSAPSPPENSP